MANYNCDACNELRNDAPNLIVNGLTNTECASLKNNTGLNPSSGNDDCTDLDNMNDCLIGNLEAEVDAYDVCNWKDFTKKHIDNEWTVLKGIICATCGLWTNIKNLWNKINELACKVDYVLGGKSYSFGEDDFILGTGISKRTGDDAVPWSLIVKGSTYRVHGSVRIDLTNSHWGSVGKATVNGINTDNGNWMISILKIKKSEYPELAHLYTCTGMTTNNACAMIVVNAYDGDDPDNNKYAGQWGTSSGEQTVPAGYIYVRIALTNAVSWDGLTDYIDCTFNATGMTKTNQSKIEC